MTTFSEYESQVLAPTWLQNSLGSLYLRSRGAQKDSLLDHMKQAVKARMPALCPQDGLWPLGRERRIDQGPGESDEHYRARLAAAWDVWGWAGTPYGLLLAFYWSGYTPTSGKVVVQSQSGWQYELRADFDPAAHSVNDAVIRTNIAPVHLGGLPSELWSDIAVLLWNPLPLAWHGTFPLDASDEVEHIRRLILAWKPAHCRCVKLQTTGNELWDYPVETWEPTTELWDEATNGVAWTPPVG